MVTSFLPLSRASPFLAVTLSQKFLLSFAALPSLLSASVAVPCVVPVALPPSKVLSPSSNVKSASRSGSVGSVSPVTVTLAVTVMAVELYSVRFLLAVSLSTKPPVCFQLLFAFAPELMRSSSSVFDSPAAFVHFQWFLFAPMVSTVPVTVYSPGLEVSTLETSHITSRLAVP